MIFNKFLIMAIFFFFTGTSQASVINVTGQSIEGTGELTSATNVLIGTDYWSVEFTPNATELCSGCGVFASPAPTGQSYAFAADAAAALRDQVFGGFFEGSVFDMDTMLINGITGLTYTKTRIDTVYGDWSGMAHNTVPLFNVVATGYDYVGSATYFDASWNSVYQTYAVWNCLSCENENYTPDTPNAVPEPSVLALISLGLLGFVSNRRRIRQA